MAGKVRLDKFNVGLWALKKPWGDSPLSDPIFIDWTSGIFGGDPNARLQVPYPP